MRGTLSLAALAVLAGCADGNSLNPVDWWHVLEGGKIADTRPPPPNADAPYPNLSSVPAKPVPPDAAKKALISKGLIADRANAQYAATLAPLSDAPKPGPTPAASRVVPPATDDTSSASLPAAAAPKPAGPPPTAPQTALPLGPPQAPLPDRPATAPRPAPTTKVQSAPLAPVPAPAAPAAPATPAGAGAPLAAADSAGLPAMPVAPPPAPKLPGVAATTAPTPAPATPPAPPPPAAAYAGGPVTVAFAPGSAVLPTSALVALKGLSQKRGDSPVAVTGYGEAASSVAAAQQAALPLALARARAIAANLLAAGVPATAIRVGAEAMGTGGAARIAN